MGIAFSRLYLAFSASPTLPVAAGLALAVLAEIASFVPIPLNIDIVVRLLLFQMVTSKNEINTDVRDWLDLQETCKRKTCKPILSDYYPELLRKSSLTHSLR